MKALFFERHGPPDVLEFGELEAPVIGEEDVLVEMKACALNHLDLWVRRGIPGLKIPLPHIGGSDIAGVVKEIGEKVSDVEPGDRVIVNPSISCGRCEFCKKGEESLCDDYKILGEHTWGGCAEFVKVPVENLMRIPDDFSYEEACAGVLTFLTAWRMLNTKAELKEGEDILILGAGGGVSSACIQIAKLKSARVIATTSSEEKMRKAYEIGADIVINYKKKDFSKEVWSITNKRGVDVVIDNVGEATFKDSIRSLRKGGRLVTCGATTGKLGEVDIRYLFWRQLKILGSTMSNRREFREVMDLVFQRKLRPVIHKILPLEDGKRAHEILERGEQFGKIVLTV